MNETDANQTSRKYVYLSMALVIVIYNSDD